MTPSEQLLRFAADCKSMARISGDPKNKPVWDGLAERWARCAEWAERQSRAAEGLRAEARLKRKDHLKDIGALEVAEEGDRAENGVRRVAKR